MKAPSHLNYFFSLFLFKVAVGAIILITSWDTLLLYKNPTISTTVIMALSFLPAAFSRPLFNKLSFLPIKKLLAINLWIAAILVMAESMLLTKQSYLAFFLNFILWIAIFIIEVSFEKWYVMLSKGIPLSGVRKLSGISTGIAQVGVITGPLLVILLKNFPYSLPYWAIFCSFLVASIPLLTSAVFNKNMNALKQENEENQDKKERIYIIAFSLIWPTLVIFNISAPLLAKMKYDSIDIAGIMEITIGTAMAIAGFSHAWVTKILTHKKRIYGLFLILTASILMVYFFDAFKSLVFIGTLLTGLSFGYFRVELRFFLSRRFSAKNAGKIIASANSWSAPLILLSCSLFYINSMIEISKGIFIILPCIFIVTSLVFCTILLNDKKLQEES